MPGNFVSVGIVRLALTRAGEFGAIRQGSPDFDVLSRSRSRIANSNEVGSHRTGILRPRAAPIEFQFRLAAENIFRDIAREPAISRGSRLDHHFSRFPRGLLDFERLTCS